MAQIPVARAQALPSHVETPTGSSPWRALARHALTRPGDAAYVFHGPEATTARTWAEVAETVERAAAGLIRSGLRADQVVVSLLRTDHPFPELDVALQAVGAVVVRVGPEVTDDDLARELAGVDVRLVVASDAADVERLQGLPLARAELFTLDGGRGWARLLELGAERLLMDPTVVERVDLVVDPGGAVPRLLAGPAGLVRIPESPFRDGVFDHRAVALVAGGPAEPLVQAVRDAHLRVGFTLCAVQDPQAMQAAAEAVRPTVLAAPEQAADVLVRVLSAAQATPGARAHRRRATSARAGRVTRLRGAAAARGSLVVVPALPDDARAAITQAGGVVEVADLDRLLPPDLPERPPVVIGDAADLPRRARREPGDEFGLRLRTEPDPVPDASAFVLPSLPLMSGESFLDRLLLSRAAEASE